MPIDREVLEAVREMDEPELRRLFMLTRARLERRGHEFPDLGPDVKIRKQMIKCGKASCTTCPHGPYVYAYWTEDGKQRSKYLGRYDDLPEDELVEMKNGFDKIELEKIGDGKHAQFHQMIEEFERFYLQ